MKYETKTERREGVAFVIFTFANGKIVELRKDDFTSGKSMIEAAAKEALA